MDERVLIDFITIFIVIALGLLVFMSIGPIIASIRQPSPTPLISIVYSYYDNTTGKITIYLYDYDPYGLSISSVILNTPERSIKFNVINVTDSDDIRTIELASTQSSTLNSADLAKGLNKLVLHLDEGLSGSQRVVFVIFFTNGWSVNGVLTT